MGFPPYDSASGCTSGPQPGALALARWIMEEYQARGAMNWGIFNCRPVRGGGSWSIHAEGRAFDCGFAVGDPDADDLLRRLLRAPGRLGIQAIIYDRWIYSRVSPEGRAYFGVNPHVDHLHIELTDESARRLTYATVAAVMERTDHKVGTRDLSEGDEGSDVAYVQKVVGAATDGVYGPKTAATVERFERSQKAKYPRLKVDGTVGVITWVAMGVTPTYQPASKKKGK
jgi:hypothetical protein